jgi:hypothetical protein
MPKTQVNFRIEPDLLEAVKDKAKEEKLDSYTQWIIDAIKMRLGELPPSSSPLDDRISEVIDQRLDKLQSPIAPLMERLELLDEHCLLAEGKVKEVALQARSKACENEDVVITLDDRIFALEESNKKSVIAFQSSQANFKAEIDNLTAKIESLENNPSQDSQEEVIEAIQVSEAIDAEIEPKGGIDAERLAPIGIQAKELSEILDIPQTTLSDWVKRKERGEGKPSRGGHKDKWSEFMEWEKHEGKWYTNNL